MKKQWFAWSLVLLVLVAGILTVRSYACLQDGCVCQMFIDEDGDGICDLCNGCIPQGDDADGDGIPNGQDDDYAPPQDGSGTRAQKGR